MWWAGRSLRRRVPALLLLRRHRRARGFAAVAMAIAGIAGMAALGWRHDDHRRDGAAGGEAAALTAISLADDWLPQLFSETSDRRQPLRAQLLQLANEQLAGKAHEHARRDRFFELYGVFPSLTVLGRRLLDEPRHRCHDQVDDRALASADDARPSPPAITAVQAHLRCDRPADRPCPARTAGRRHRPRPRSLSPAAHDPGPGPTGSGAARAAAVRQPRAGLPRPAAGVAGAHRRRRRSDRGRLGIRGQRHRVRAATGRGRIPARTGAGGRHADRRARRPRSDLARHRGRGTGAGLDVARAAHAAGSPPGSPQAINSGSGCRCRCWPRCRRRPRITAVTCRCGRASIAATSG